MYALSLHTFTCTRFPCYLQSLLQLLSQAKHVNVNRSEHGVHRAEPLSP